MPVVHITLSVPDGTEIRVDGLTGGVGTAALVDEADALERYWRDYLSDNGRRIYAAAARLEDHQGPGYTLEEIAANLSITYESARSMHRTSGRSARKWRDDTGTDEPIRLDWLEYEWEEASDGMRTAYRLPDGTLDTVLLLARS